MIQRIAFIATGILVALDSSGWVSAGTPHGKIPQNPVRLSDEIELLAPKETGKAKPPQARLSEESNAVATSKPKTGFRVSSPRTILRTAFPELFPIPEEDTIPATPATIPPPPSFDSYEPIRVPNTPLTTPEPGRLPGEFFPESIFEEQFVESCLQPSGECIDEVVPQTNRKWSKWRFPTLNTLFKK